MLAGKQAARAPEARGDLVRDQQHVRLVAERSHPCEILRRVEPHASGALHDRLEDHRGQLVAMLLQQLRELCRVCVGARLAEATFGARRKEVGGKAALEETVHSCHRITHGHRAEGIPVIATANREQPPLRRAPLRLPDLQRHLDRNLDGNRPRIAQKAALQAFG